MLHFARYFVLDINIDVCNRRKETNERKKKRKFCSNIRKNVHEMFPVDILCIFMFLIQVNSSKYFDVRIMQILLILIQLDISL